MEDWKMGSEDGLCVLCEEFGPLTLEHVIPESLGNTEVVGRVLCARCNNGTSKFDQKLVEALRPHTAMHAIPSKSTGKTPHVVIENTKNSVIVLASGQMPKRSALGKPIDHNDSFYLRKFDDKSIAYGFSQTIRFDQGLSRPLHKTALTALAVRKGTKVGLERTSADLRAWIRGEKHHSRPFALIWSPMQDATYVGVREYRANWLSDSLHFIHILGLTFVVSLGDCPNLNQWAHGMEERLSTIYAIFPPETLVFFNGRGIVKKKCELHRSTALPNLNHLHALTSFGEKELLGIVSSEVNRTLASHETLGKLRAETMLALPDALKELAEVGGPRLLAKRLASVKRREGQGNYLWWTQWVALNAELRNAFTRGVKGTV